MQMDRPAYDVVISRDGHSGLGVTEFEGAKDSARRAFDIALFFEVRLVPKERHSRLMVSVDDMFLESLTQTPLRLAKTKENALEQLGLFVIGTFLDEHGTPVFTPSGMPAEEIKADQAVQSLYGVRPQATDAEVFRYVTAKVYWAWRFGMHSVGFNLADHLRLAVPSGDLDRVSLMGEGVYWNRIGSEPSQYAATGKLIQDFQAGRIPGIERSPLIQIQERLQSPRYAAVLEHLSKGLGYLSGASQDLPNSVKEATMAVESLAMLVTGRSAGTLGDFIKDLRQQGRLAAPLDKVFEGLWGFASQEPGVRHGKASPPSLVERDATLVFNLAAAAILYLLDLDR
jgi:hypothetical protein